MLYKWMIACLLVSTVVQGQDKAANDQEQPLTAKTHEFFEKQVRPLLVKHCYECHSDQGEAPKGGLRLDLRQGWMNGGDSGPAIEPGNVEDSLILKAVRYEDYEMPPERRLSDEEVAILEQWVKLGAPDPRTGKLVQHVNEIDFEAARQFWAFQPLRQPTLPEVGDPEWSRSAIDRFVHARLREVGLQAAKQATPRQWLRRVKFDLVGLPPTGEEMEAFLQDPNPEARRRIVDEYLASLQFGEHWGRHWLDVARYADSNGGDINLTYYNAWRYRDYVVDAFNNDKPFAEFVRQQVAGDLIPGDEDRTENLIATGFLIVGPKMLSERDKEKLVMDVVDEQLDSIGRVFMGLTLGCARCHDHKFDPIPTTDYYALAGMLRSTETIRGIRLNNQFVSGWVERELPVAEDIAAEIAAGKRRLADLDKRLADLKKQIDGIQKKTLFAVSELPGVVVDDVDAIKVGAWKNSTHTPRYVGKGYIHDDKKDKGEKSVEFKTTLPESGEYEVRISFASANGRDKRVPVTIYHAEGSTQVTVDQEKMPEHRQLFHTIGRFKFSGERECSVKIETSDTTDYVIVDAVQFLPVTQVDEPQPVSPKPHSKLVELESLKKKLDQQRKEVAQNVPKQPMAMAPADRELPVDCHLRIRGEVHHLGEKVPRGFLTVTRFAGQPQIASDASGRLELAEWLVHAHNPLPYRVAANRVWHHLFGRGIVGTVDNFGHLGDRPSHPELLDYLALQFVENNGSFKHLIRQIVLSRTYASASDYDQQAYIQDPQNRWLWRHSRRRLNAESLRDAILSVSGQLDLTTGGSSVIGMPEQAIANNAEQKSGDRQVTYRRSLYLPILRNDLPPSLAVFDFADPDMVSGARNVTTVPAQALWLMNSAMAREAAALIAGRLTSTDEDNELTQESLVTRAYHQILCRNPNASEQDRAISYLNLEQREGATRVEAFARLCQALMASTEFRLID